MTGTASPGREIHLRGLAALEAASAVLRRVRHAHPTAGLLEAADLQWWWRSPRATDHVPQLFWFDDAGRPEAAVIATDWGDAVTLDPIVSPDTAPSVLEQVLERGIAHAGSCGFEALDVVIDAADLAARDLLVQHGFTADDDGAQAADSLAVVTAWRTADTPPVPPLQAGYRLLSRTDTLPQPHHMLGRSGPAVEQRLRQTALYRPDLDLLVLDAHSAVSAYGLFWLDPETGVGLVEPMRTEAGHQRRGLGRHVLLAGIARLAQAGATRIKLCFKPGNAAAQALYLGCGFAPDKRTLVFSRRARP